MSGLTDPRKSQVFRFVGADYDAATATASLRYAFDDDAVMIERIVFPAAPALPRERETAFAMALQLLHLIAGVSYYKAGVPPAIHFEGDAPDVATTAFLHEIYLHGLGEFAYHNRFDLRSRLASLLQSPDGQPLRRRVRRSNFSEPAVEPDAPYVAAIDAPSLRLPRRTLLPIGGGKDSLVSVEMCKSIQEPATAIWVGDSALIAACAARTGLPLLNIKRALAPELFEYNRLGAWNGHVPVTAINSAILICAAILYGYDAIAFSNERSASSATLEYDGQEVNHQWSKGVDFERRLREYTKLHIAADLDYFSLLRPWSELAVARAFAKSAQYDDAFSSCNRNFRILGTRPADRWCGECPKCHFVFLALAPFVSKPRLLKIFGRNLLDDAALAPGFDALLEYREHKPFECVGEGRESRAALHTLAQRAEWREDALVARYAREIAPQLDTRELGLDGLLAPSITHYLPARFEKLLHAAH